MLMFHVVRVLYCFQEEMMVQKDSIRLEKTITWN